MEINEINRAVRDVLACLGQAAADCDDRDELLQQAEAHLRGAATLTGPIFPGRSVDGPARWDGPRIGMGATVYPDGRAVLEGQRRICTRRATNQHDHGDFSWSDGPPTILGISSAGG